MSIEQRLEELTAAISKLTTSMAQAVGATQTVSASTEKQPSVESNTKVEREPSDDTTEEMKVAGRRTLVWDKEAKQGTVVEKGEVVPTGDNLSTVGKAAWDKACEKYNLDPETGKPAVAAEEPADEDLPSDEDDLDLGLDDEEPVSELELKDVKAQLIKVMREKSREDVMKLLKKHGAKNADELKTDSYQAIFDDAQALLDA